MSNRNFDASSIIQRLKDKNAAQNIYRSQVLGQQTLSNPQNSNASGEVIVNYNQGSQTTYQKGLLGSDTTANLGGSFIGTSPFDNTNKSYAPYLMSYTSGMYSVTLTFSQGIFYTPTIINYQYSLNGGVTFTAFNPPQTTSPMTITGLANSQTYNVVIRAVSANGTSPASNILPMMTNILPTAPTILSATPGNQSISVAFTAGSPGSIPGSTVVQTITNYLYSTDNGLTYASFSPAQTITPLTITKLSSNQGITISNNTAYTILLKTVSGTGTSSASGSVTVTPGVPSAPVIAVTSYASGTVVLTVTVANNGGFTITNYLYSIDGAAFVSYGSATSPMTLTGFLAGSHTIRVIAQNTYYNSPVSNTVTPTVGASAPNPPTGLIASAGTVGGTISVAFTAGANNGAVIDNYYYTFSTDGTNYSSPPVVLNQTTSPITISGLLHANNYYIKLYANNTSGQSSASTPSNAVIPIQTVPAAPTIGVISATSTTITVNFTLNAANGATITQYQYSTNGTDYTSATALPGGGPTYTFTITNETGSGTPALTTGKSYIISLKVINAAGPSLAATSISVTPGAPNAPTALTVTTLPGFKGYNYATVSFTPGANNGSAITNYKYSLNGISYTTFNPPVGATSLVTVPIAPSSSSNNIVYLQAVNQYGSSQPGQTLPFQLSQSFTKPASPTIITVIPGNTTAIISFLPGQNGGGAVPTYTYSTTPSTSTGTLTTTGTYPDTLTGQITGLTNGISYTITITERNNSLDSPSVTSGAVIPGLPLPPSSLSVTPGNTNATIYFTPGEDNGAAVTAYQYKLYNISTNTYTPSSGYTSITPSGPPLFFSVTGLTNAQQYIVYVQNQNSRGWSADSSMMFIPNSTAAGYPSPPTALNATTTGSGQVTVTFTAGSGTASGTVTYQYLTYDLTTGISTNYAPLAVTGTYPNVRGSIPLLTNHAYVISIANRNPTGWSYDSTVNVIVGGPLALVVGTITPGNQTIVFTFTPGADSGGPPVSEYAYTTDGINFAPLTVASTGTTPPYSGTITTESFSPFARLTNGTLYNICVTELNQNGSSSCALVTATPYTGPAIPNVSGTQGNSTILLTFSGPSDTGGGTITSYQYSTDDTVYTSFYTTAGHTPPYTATITNQSATSSTAAFVVGASYTVYIKAVNSNGGISAAANTGSITVITLPNAPTTPITPTTNPATPSQVVITFTGAIIDSGHPFIKYQYSLDNSTYFDPASQTSTSVTITGLKTSNPYTIYLKSYNSIGLSSINISTSFHTYSNAPTSVVATAGFTAGTSNIAVTFIAPASTGGTDPITTYWYSINADFSSPVNLGSTSTSFTISPVTPGTLYTIYVKAANVAGLSAAGTSNSVTPYTYPGTPQTLSFVAADGGGTISFISPASDGYSTISVYYFSTNSGGPFQEPNHTTTTSTLVLTGLTNGQSYTYYIVAHNAAGNSQTPATITITAGAAGSPSAPTSLAATPYNGYTSIAFTAGSDGGSPITNYRYSTGGAYTTFSPPQTSSPVTIVGLSNSVAYTVTLEAITAVYNSSPSDPVTFTQPATVTVPIAPRITGVTVQNNQVTIAVTQEPDGGASIDKFQYSTFDGTTHTVYADCTSFSPVSVGPPATYSVIITGGLPLGTPFTIQLEAHNSAGNSLASVPSSSVTVYASPAVPASITAIAGNAQITLDFSAPGSTGGSAITGYQYSTDSVKTWSTTFTVTGSAPYSHIITTLSSDNSSLLQNGTGYPISIRAINAYWPGVSGSPSPSTVTPYTVPGVPTNLSYTPGNNSVSITFSAPSNDGGSAVTGYFYSNSSGGPFNTSCSSPLNISGLTNGTQYTYYIVAHNAAGNGAYASILVTPSIAPSPPTGLTVLPGDGQVTISFTAGSDGGSAITNYEYSTNASAGSPTYMPFDPVDAASPVTITLLSNTTTYNIALKAVNANSTSSPSAILSATPGISLAPHIDTAVFVVADTTISITFTPGAYDGSVGYKYSTDGTTYKSFTPTGSTYIITTISASSSPLVNGIPYPITIIETTTYGDSAASNSVTVNTPPSVPTLFAAVRGDASAVITFSAPANNGGSPVLSTYEYSLDGGSYTIFTPTNTGSTPSYSYTITGLTNGQEYAIRLKAINAIGAGTAAGPVTVTPTAAPGAPTITDYAAGDQEITITFSAPADDGGSAITDYTYTTNGTDYYPLDSYTGSDPYDATITTQTNIARSDLVNGTSYTISIKAVNDVSAGAASNEITDTPYSGPDPPTLSYVPGNTEVTIGIVITTPTGSPALTYKYSIDGSSYIDVVPTGSPLTFLITTDGGSPLINGDVYTIRVRVDNPVGFSYNEIDVTPGKPLPPTIVSGTPGNGKATIAFTAGANNGSAITNYQYSVNGGAYTELDPVDTASPITILDLDGGFTYRIRLEAINANGTSIASNYVDITPTSAAPDPPTGLTAAPRDGYARVSFTPGYYNGSDIINYEYSLNGTDYTLLSPADITSPVTIPGLTNGTSYTIYLKAVNNVSAGAASLSASVTPVGAPNAPTITSFTPGDDQVTIYFTPGATPASNPTTGYQYSLDSGAYTTFTPIGSVPPYSYNFTGLTNGAEYTITLIATNAAPTPSAASNEVTVTPGVPFAPTSLGFTPGNNRAIIDFTSGGTSDPASTISNYQYSTDDGLTYWPFVPPTGNVTQVTIDYLSSDGTTPLVNGVEYTIRLEAFNVNGYSSESDPVTGTPFPPPPAPTLSYTPANGSVTIALENPAPPAYTLPITVYYSTEDESNYTLATIIPGSPPTFVVGSLTNGTLITIYVKAHNAAGDGPSSTIQVYPGVPTAPNDVTAASSTGTPLAIDIEWTLPSTDGGTAITGYKYSTDSGTTFKAFSFISGGLPTYSATITEPSNSTDPLNHTTLYSIQIIATNGFNGLLSAPVSAYPSVNLHAPVIISAIPASGQMVLTYIHNPDDVGITGYIYAAYATGGGPPRYTSVGVSTTIAITQTTDDTPVTLNNGTNYTFIVKALIGTIISPAATISMVVQASPTYTPFTAYTTWTAPADVTIINYWMVGGGGGGGGAYDNGGAGGGGGGSAIQGTYTVVPGQEYTITVGTGGAGGTGATGGPETPGIAGTASSFGTGPSASGGLGGNKSRGGTIRVGGSATEYSEPDIAIAPAQGGGGGYATPTGFGGAGGGGGSSTNGVTGTEGTGGAGGSGGSGTTFTISGTSFGVGGAGGSNSVGTSIPGADGAANTGNGGGGASAASSSDASGGAGGSGFVEIMFSSTY